MTTMFAGSQHIHGVTGARAPGKSTRRPDKRYALSNPAGLIYPYFALAAEEVIREHLGDGTMSS